MRTVLLTLVLVSAGCSHSKRLGLRDSRGPQLPATLRTLHSGPVLGYQDLNGAHAWLGIPYAQPPTGLLRWKAPRPVTAWSQPRDATRFGEVCPQVGSLLSNTPEEKWGQVVGSEDCLTLNVYAPPDASPEPKPAEKNRRPVMVWIHGGGNSIGTGATYELARNLAIAHNVVVVTVNYRLGLFGWFHHPALVSPDDTPEDRSGNYGTLDLIQALRWVKNEVAVFGGDPENVTVFGESAGGMNIYSLLVAPAAKGLFHKAIIQSGMPTSWPLSAGANYTDDEQEPGHRFGGRELVNTLFVQERLAKDRLAAKARQEQMTHKELAAYLRSRAPQSLLAPFKAAPFGMYLGAFILRDGAVIPDAPITSLLSDATKTANVPVLLGTNRDEMKLFLSRDDRFVSYFLGLVPRIRDVPRYNLTASYLSRAWKAIGADMPAARLVASGSPVYAYRFDWDEEGKPFGVDLPTLLGAAHGFDVFFVFLDLEGSNGFARVATKENYAGRKFLSEAMASYWAQFAYTGAPGKGRDGSLPEWKPWTAEDPGFQVLDTVEGGGLRRSSESVTLPDLEKELLADPSFAVRPEEKCQLLYGIFHGFGMASGHWNAEQYAKSGCGKTQNVSLLE